MGRAISQLPTLKKTDHGASRQITTIVTATPMRTIKTFAAEPRFAAAPPKRGPTAAPAA